MWGHWHDATPAQLGRTNGPQASHHHSLQDDPAGGSLQGSMAWSSAARRKISRGSRHPIPEDPSEYYLLPGLRQSAKETGGSTVSRASEEARG